MHVNFYRWLKQLNELYVYKIKSDKKIKEFHEKERCQMDEKSIQKQHIRIAFVYENKSSNALVVPRRDR